MTYFRVDYDDVITFPTFGPVTDVSSAYAGYRTVRPAGVSDAQWLQTITPMLAGFRHDGAIYPDVAGLPTAVYDLRRQNFANERISGIDYSFGYQFNTGFGNGDPIGADVMELLNQVYEAHTLREPWQAGDLMLVDNIAMAHSREAYQGQREVLVGMTDPVRMPTPGTGSAR